MICFETVDWYKELAELRLLAAAQLELGKPAEECLLCAIEDIGIILMDQSDPRVAQA